MLKTTKMWCLCAFCEVCCHPLQFSHFSAVFAVVVAHLDSVRCGRRRSLMSALWLHDDDWRLPNDWHSVRRGDRWFSHKKTPEDWVIIENIDRRSVICRSTYIELVQSFSKRESPPIGGNRRNETPCRSYNWQKPIFVQIVTNCGITRTTSSFAS